MHRKGHGHHSHNNSSHQKISVLGLPVNHTSDSDRPKPIIDGINNIGRALAEAGERRRDEKRREQKEHDKLVGDAARAKVYEEQRRASELNRLVNDMLQSFTDIAAEGRIHNEAMLRQSELDLAIARERLIQVEREVAEKKRQDKIRSREAEIEKIQQVTVEEFERLKNTALQLASVGNYSEALLAIDKAITEMQHSKNVWLSFQHEMRIKNPEKYRYADIALAEIEPTRRDIEFKQRDALLKQEWEHTKESVHMECKSLLLAQPPASDLPGYIEKLNSYQIKFAKQRHNFDWLGNDSGMEGQLLEKIAESKQLLAKRQAEQLLASIKVEDNKIQNRINEYLVLVRTDLEDNNLRAAAANLSRACELANNITNPSNIELASNYVPYDVLNSSLQKVKNEVEEAYMRAQEYVPKITQFIVEQALKQIDPERGENCLYTDHLIRLKGKINACLTENWYKFDSREFPESFLNNLIALIKSNIKRIGWIRYFEDWSKSMSVVSEKHPLTGAKEFPLLEQHIQSAIDAYVPEFASPVFFMVPVFPDRMNPAADQLCNKPILQAEEVHECHTGASFASVVPTTSLSLPPLKPKF